MPTGLESIIAQLERQKSAVGRALEALRNIEGTVDADSLSAADKRANAPAKRKGGLTPEGRRRLAEAMKRRWAVKRTAAQAKKRGRKAA